MRDSFDPIQWAEKNVGSYRRFLMTMGGFLAAAVWAGVTAFTSPPQALVPIVFMAVQGTALSATLRRVLLIARACAASVSRS